MRGIIIKLEQIQKKLDNGTYMNQKDKLIKKVESIESEVRNKTYTHREVRYDNDVQAHLPVYRAWIRAGKYKTLSDLYELKHELSKEEINVLRANAIINKLISTNLHQKKVTATIRTFASRAKSKHGTTLTAR
ncbi:hypothetical protein [Guptibacillus hwajinpoensis]|uniref:hypothetical protein n=1 Tax=Guptibacillus hwajinpoensis TaxID=208199 RepID=UPI0024B36158|nr:hypothetical protein [Pseudalkalibacillus hwajinpoensis]